MPTARLFEAVSTPPEELLALDLASLVALRDELRKLPHASSAFWPGASSPEPPDAERSEAEAV